MIVVRQGDRRAAFDVPFNAYPAPSPYASPMRSDFERLLDPGKNPLAQEGRGRFELFTAHRDGLALGRIVACIHDASNLRHHTNRGQFGFFDSVDDPEVMDALLAAAEAWVSAQGADEIVGNFNLTAMQMVGVVTEGFEGLPFIDMMWSPPHIAAHLSKRGYETTFPMTTFETDLDRLDPSVLLGPKQHALMEDAAFSWMPVTRRSLAARLDDARQILNDGFDRNPMFVPLSREEFFFQAEGMSWVLDPRLSVVVHHKGQPAGIVVCIPDLNPLLRSCGSRISWTTPWHYLRYRWTRRRAVIVYYSVASHLQNVGLNGAMLHRVVAAAKAAGYRSLGTTWIADVNRSSLRQMGRLGARPLHRLHLFRKALDAR